MSGAGLSRWRRLAGPGIILLAAAVATTPILLHGSFCGDDLEFHAVSWFDAQQSWLHGIAYPHWMPSANYGAGEPRFMFYPPLTWMLGAALGFVLPWPLAPVTLIFLFLAGTGLAARALALEALSDAPATLAGCAALFSGFALFTAYERTAFAELMGGFWIPLLLLYALSPFRRSGGAAAPERSAKDFFRWRVLDGSVLPMALVVAGCWLSDGPVGVMACYLLAAVGLTASVMTRSWIHVVRAAIAAVLGVALPALYLIPAAWEQRWVDLRAAVDYPVFKIENNWLFARHTDPLLAPFEMVLHRASMLEVSMIGVALLGLLVFRLRQRRAAVGDARKLDLRWWIPLALIPAAVLFLQFPVSLPVWNLLPKMRFLQYPWRWTLVVEAPMGIFFAAAVWPARPGRKWVRGAIAAVCALAFLTTTYFAGRSFLRVCNEGDTVADLLAMYRGGGGVEGTDEYEPPGTDHWQLAAGLPDACFTTDSDTTLGVTGPGEQIPAWRREQGSCQATATDRIREPEHLRMSTVTAQEGFLILRLLSYPAWRVTVNGRPAGELPQRDDGLMVVPVPKGAVDVAVDWSTTPDVVAGRCLSGLALLVLLAVGVLERKHSRARLS